jgi:hypothetical protein
LSEICKNFVKPGRSQSGEGSLRAAWKNERLLQKHPDIPGARRKEKRGKRQEETRKKIRIKEEEDPRAAFKQACYLPEDGMA